jgi:hypothetical protein
VIQPRQEGKLPHLEAELKTLPVNLGEVHTVHNEKTVSLTPRAVKDISRVVIYTTFLLDIRVILVHRWKGGRRRKDA